MRIAIAGSGAMGCRFGSMLYEAGNDVLLVDEWPDHVEAIKNKGLEIVNENGTYTPGITAAFPYEAHGEVDLLIVFTKAMQTDSMVRSCKHLINKETRVLTLQNGLGNIEILKNTCQGSILLQE